MFNWLKKTRQREIRYVPVTSARYDSETVTHENKRWWAQADDLGSNASTSRERRKAIRRKARYEIIQGNSYARGIVEAKKNDVIGTGPTLQVMGRSTLRNQTIEQAWHDWAEEIDLAGKLRVLYSAKVVDGEGFAELINNDTLSSDVKLDVRLSECELWTDNLTEFEAYRRGQPEWIDGIHYDQSGNPIEYRRLRRHPGELFPVPVGNDFDTIPSDLVLHWYRVDRPGQMRGISEFAPALELFAELRRYTKAVISAAETAAEFAAVLEGEVGSFGSVDIAPDELPPDRDISIFRRMMRILPRGWRMKQLQAEQPTTQFPEFVDAIVREVTRCLQVPLNIATGSSRDSNFASARLDYILYWGACDVERKECACRVLNKIFRAWLDEFTIGQFTNMPHKWFFPARRPIDEVKSAQAKKTLFEIGHLVDEDVFAEEARDPERTYEAMERMIANRKRVGMPIPGGNQGGFSEPEEQEEESEETADV